MSILLIISAVITGLIFLVLYAAAIKLIKEHKELHSVKEDEDLDLPKPL